MHGFVSNGFLPRFFQISGLPPASVGRKLRKLFSSTGSIYIASGTSPSPTDLKMLIEMGGGLVRWAVSFFVFFLLKILVDCATDDNKNTKNGSDSFA